VSSNALGELLEVSATTGRPVGSLLTCTARSTALETDAARSESSADTSGRSAVEPCTTSSICRTSLLRDVSVQTSSSK
jgi:hypothetical protein